MAGSSMASGGGWHNSPMWVLGGTALLVLLVVFATSFATNRQQGATLDTVAHDLVRLQGAQVFEPISSEVIAVAKDALSGPAEVVSDRAARGEYTNQIGVIDWSALPEYDVAYHNPFGKMVYPPEDERHTVSDAEAAEYYPSGKFHSAGSYNSDFLDPVGSYSDLGAQEVYPVVEFVSPDAFSGSNAEIEPSFEAPPYPDVRYGQDAPEGKLPDLMP